MTCDREFPNSSATLMLARQLRMLCEPRWAPEGWTNWSQLGQEQSLAMMVLLL